MPPKIKRSKFFSHPTSEDPLFNAVFKKLTDHHRVGLIFLVVLLLWITYKLLGFGSAWAVEVNGHMVAVVTNRLSVQSEIKNLLKDKEKFYGKPVTIAEEIKFQKVNGGKKLTEPDDLKKQLNSILTFKGQGTALLVNGDQKLAFKNRSIAQNFLDRLKKIYQDPPGSKVVFLEKIELTDRLVNLKDVVSLSEAMSLAKSDLRKHVFYIVKDGDTLWDIASAHKISLEELKRLNPQVNPDRLSLGQILKLPEGPPFINVVTTYNKAVNEKISPSVQVKQDSRLYMGESKILQVGKPGLKEVIYQVTKLNGVETKQKVLSEKIIVHPVPKVKARGSANIQLASRGGSPESVRWPVIGTVISTFGMRSGRLHEGIDIGNNNGNLVFAAKSGKVSWAGWYGGYGLSVDIDHGWSVVTRYAHLSNIYVSAGQEVTRGQVIEKVGATGNATAPHLHFEVRINGRAQNPARYF